jgi:hypothetical protein
MRDHLSLGLMHAITMNKSQRRTIADILPVRALRLDPPHCLPPSSILARFAPCEIQSTFQKVKQQPEIQPNAFLTRGLEDLFRAISEML